MLKGFQQLYRRETMLKGLQQLYRRETKLKGFQRLYRRETMAIGLLEYSFSWLGEVIKTTKARMFIRMLSKWCVENIISLLNSCLTLFLINCLDVYNV